MVTIETPKGSNAKYRYDASTNSFHLKKLLPLGMYFPYDFGFVPETKGEDGDPLDALVISETGSFPGCRIECRLIGALLAEQVAGSNKVRNDRLFFVPEASILFEGVPTIHGLPKPHLKQLEDFFVAYNKAEGKIFKPIKTVGSTAALELLNR